eukprot:COSAG01_NODE_23_length_37704_cov_30.005877_39_plen_68_part_00
MVVRISATDPGFFKKYAGDPRNEQRRRGISATDPVLIVKYLWQVVAVNYRLNAFGWLGAEVRPPLPH